MLFPRLLLLSPYLSALIVTPLTEACTKLSTAIADAGYTFFSIPADAPLSLPTTVAEAGALDTLEELEDQIACTGLLIVGTVALQIWAGMRVTAYASAAAADEKTEQVLRESEKAEEGRGRSRQRKEYEGGW